MKTSDSQAALAPALFAAKGEFPRIAKGKKGQSGNRTFNYAPLDAILDACEPVLRNHGLMLTQGTDGHDLVTRLEHAQSGEWRETRMPINAEHANMQSYGIEVTYRRRYSVQLIIGIVTEEDIDIKEKARRKGADLTTDAGNKDGGFRVSATGEAWKMMDAEAQAWLAQIAERVIEFCANDPYAALNYIEEQRLDQDEKAALSYKLDSKTRTALKLAGKAA